MKGLRLVLTLFSAIWSSVCALEQGISRVLLVCSHDFGHGPCASSVTVREYRSLPFLNVH